MSDFLQIVEQQGLSIALVCYLLWEKHTQGNQLLKAMQEYASSNRELSQAIKYLKAGCQVNGTNSKNT